MAKLTTYRIIFESEYGVLFGDCLINSPVDDDRVLLAIGVERYKRFYGEKIFFKTDPNKLVMREKRAYKTFKKDAYTSGIYK